MAKRRTPQAKSAAKGPSSYAGEIFSLLVALGGPQLVTTFAPPSANYAIVRVIVASVSAIAWGVALLLCNRLKPQESVSTITRRELLLFGLMLIAIIIAGILYINTWETYSVDYYGQRVLTGTTLTEPGRDYFSSDEGASRFDALKAAGGVASDVWTVSSINWTRWGLMLYFVTVIFAAVFCFVMLWQVSVRLLGKTTLTK